MPALASLTPSPADAAGVSFMTAMQDASQARQVPLPLIEATAYVNSWFEWIGTPSIDGGVGPMHVVPSQMAPASSTASIATRSTCGPSSVRSSWAPKGSGSAPGLGKPSGAAAPADTRSIATSGFPAAGAAPCSYLI